MIDPILFTATRICTFNQQTPLTNASGFFFESDQRLFLVTSRHVLRDDPSGHLPDRIEIELHSDPDNLAISTAFSIPLYRDGEPCWRQGHDRAGTIDVAAIEIDRHALPAPTRLRALTPAHVYHTDDRIEVGTALLIVGFPLGFHDALHHMPVARQATIASSFGLRFQGEGYFLTDARTHRGTSGAAVVMRVADDTAGLGDLPWKLLGIHSTRFDVDGRDSDIDEALGLNSAWYADAIANLIAG